MALMEGFEKNGLVRQKTPSKDHEEAEKQRKKRIRQRNLKLRSWDFKAGGEPISSGASPPKAVFNLSQLLMSYTTPHHTGWGERHAQLTELCLNKSWSEWESAFHSVYCKKYRQQIHFQSKIEPFSLQTIQELVLEFNIVTTNTGKLRVKDLTLSHTIIIIIIIIMILFLKRFSMLNMLNCAVQCQWTTHTHTHTHARARQKHLTKEQ